jgi:hypothetical protein
VDDGDPDGAPLSGALAEGVEHIGWAALLFAGLAVWTFVKGAVVAGLALLAVAAGTAWLTVAYDRRARRHGHVGVVDVERAWRWLRGRPSHVDGSADDGRATVLPADGRRTAIRT